MAFPICWTLKRITIMLDEKIEAKLRVKQAQQIRKTKGAVSFSQILNESLAECLGKKLN